jgi:predicted nucleic acid-binding protein
MSAYYDTGVLLPLYVNEVFSGVITSLVEQRGEPISINVFHELEFENALRLKVFRREIAAEELDAVLHHRDEDIEAGRLTRVPVNWPQAFSEARRRSSVATAKAGCRALDLLHVAVAVKWASGTFVTGDDRQLNAAAAAGLTPIDVKALGKDRRGRRRAR